jgi:tetratricopeptide (TPR) repeat protein
MTPTWPDVTGRTGSSHGGLGTQLGRGRGRVPGTIPGAPRAVPGGPGLPLPLDGSFIDRPDTAPGLIAALAPGAVVVLAPAHEDSAGTAGWRGSCGKTALAADAAMSLRRSGAVAMAAWVDASSRASALDGYLAMAADLGAGDPGDAETVAAGVCASLRASTAPWLVVLDDLRDPADLEGIWPDGGAGTVLATAGSLAVAQALPRARVQPVPFFSDRESMDFLSRRLSTDPDHRSGQIDLALALDREPAALAQASAVIATSELTCRDYLAIFLKRRSQLAVTAGRGICAASVTWTVSADHAEILEPGAGTWPLLVLASLLAPRGVPAGVLASGPVGRYLAGEEEGAAASGPGRAAAALSALQAAGLLAVAGDSGLQVARMSSALQAAVRRAADPALLRRAATAAADALAEAWPAGGPLSALAALMRSCAVSLRQAAGDALWTGGRYHKVLVVAGQGMDAAGLHGPAAAWWQQLARDSGQRLGAGNEEAVTAGSLAASALLAAGQPADAVAWAEWVMTSRADALGPGHPGTVRAAVTLSQALSAAGRPGDAAALLSDAAERSAQASGPGHPATLDAWDEHAAACLAGGDPAAAASSLNRSLATRRQVLGTGHPATATAATQLARAYLAGGQHDQAIAACEQLAGWLEAAHGPDHAGTLAAGTLLAEAHGAAGNVSTALRHHEQAHARHEQVLGPQHRQTLACAAALARAYAGAGQITAAMSLLAATISLAGRHLPPGDPLTRELLQARAGLARQ